MAVHFTVGNTDPRVQYNTVLGQTVYSIPWEFFDNDDIEIYYDDSDTPVSSSAYTIAGAQTTGGGSVTFDSAPKDAGYDKVTIVGNRDIERQSDFSGSSWRPDTVNDEIDILIMLMKQLNSIYQRTFRLSETDSDAALILPALADRASKFLGFDASGLPIASEGSVDGLTVSAFIATLIDDADAATALATLTAAGTALANTFTKTQAWAKGADVASATNLVPAADGNMWDVTGTTAIETVDSGDTVIPVGSWYMLQFDGACQLTNSANLVVQGAANYTTAAGDVVLGHKFAAGQSRLFLLRANGKAAAPSSSPFFGYSSGSLTLAGATFYLTAGSNPAESSISRVIPFACVISDLVIEVSAAPGASETFTFTLRKNGADTGLTVVISDTDTTAEELATSISFAKGDTWNLKVVGSGSAASAIIQFGVRIKEA